MHRILLEISGFSIYSYGVMLSLALLLATLLLCRQALREGISYDHALEVVIALIVGGVVGARVLYIFLEWERYSGEWMSVFYLRGGGLSIFGGFLGGAFALLLWCLWRKIPFLKAADLVSPYLIFGYAFGRIGCFLNGCCFGKVSHNLFAVSLPAVDGLTRHPVQLYAAIGSLLIFLALINLRRIKAYNGFLLIKLSFLYGLMRFSTEFFREGETWLGPLTMAQVFSLVIMLLSAMLSILLYRNFIARRQGLVGRGK